MNKKGQVTIFIIIAFVIVSAIALFFVFRGGVLTPEIGEAPEKNPSSFMGTCLEEKVQETVSTISAQGGYMSNPLNKTFKFEGENSFTDISYLCYTSNYYIPCINQEPMLIQHLKSEIKNTISEDVETCFDKLKSSLEGQGFAVDAKYNGFEIELTEGRIILNVDAKLTLTKTGETSSYDKLDVVLPSKFYDTALVVQEIVSQEAKYCNFEYLGYMTLYPQWEIDKFRTSDSIVIYTVKNKDSIDKFKFAIRSCSIRPGGL